MKNSLLIVVLLLVLVGCSLPKKQEIIIENDVYVDPNVPSVYLKFPFDVYLYSQNVFHNSNNSIDIRSESVSLRTNDSKKYIYIEKASLMQGNAYYTGVNYEKEELYYSDIRNNSNGCFLYYKNIKDKNYLIGDVIKYTSDRSIINIRITYFLSSVYGYSDATIKYKDEIEDMESNVKYLCSQILDNENYINFDNLKHDEKGNIVYYESSSLRTKYDDALKFYENGSYDKAFSLFEDLANKGHAESAFKIADMYDFGIGTEKSYVRSAKWYLYAAERGHAEAQCAIAERYNSNGLGIKRDAEEAYKWYCLCVKNTRGISHRLKENAKRSMRALHSVEVLSSGQISAIEETCNLWEPKDSLQF